MGAGAGGGAQPSRSPLRPLSHPLEGWGIRRDDTPHAVPAAVVNDFKTAWGDERLVLVFISMKRSSPHAFGILGLVVLSCWGWPSDHRSPGVCALPKVHRTFGFCL